MFLLDSNAWITVFRKKSQSLVDEVKRREANEIVLCSIVISELWFGVCRSAPDQRAKNAQLINELCAKHVSLPFDDVAARDCAELRSHLAAIGLPIGPFDLQIAAIARTNGATLITHNVAEFSRVPGLLIQDWQ